MTTAPDPYPTRQQGSAGTGATRHGAEWVAAGLRRSATNAGVALPADYARAIATDGLGHSAELGVSRLGAGVVIHTRPASHRELPLLLGYADARGQWYRDGHRHTPAQPAADISTGRSGLDPVA